MRPSIWLAALLLAVPALARAEPSKPWIKPSTNETVGSGGYWRYALSADGGWHETNVDPYAYASWSEDNFVRELLLVGGVSKELDKRTTVSGGAGLAAGTVKSVDARGGSFQLELGATRDAGPGTLGLDYTLDTGNLSVGRYSAAASRPFQAQGLRGPGKSGKNFAPAPALQPQTYNELSASYKWPFDAFTLILRETLGLPSYSGPIYTETVGAKVPFGERLSATASVDVDGGSNSGVYVSAGLAYLFD